MQRRLIMAGGSLVLALLFIAILSITLEGSSLGTILLDRKSANYPFTIQNTMWIMFFFGLGELITRLLSGIEQQGQMKKKFLPEDESTLLQGNDLGPIIKKLNQDPDAERFFLQRLLKRTILQFQSSRSINQADSLMNSTMELYQHETDMKYSMVRYLVWLIPTLGFRDDYRNFSRTGQGQGFSGHECGNRVRSDSTKSHTGMDYRPDNRVSCRF